jgi:hypothetical protein
MAHLVIIGDSQSRQFHDAAFCSIQRTLGTRVVSRRSLVLDMVPQQLFRIWVNKGDLYSVPLFTEETIVELNSTLKGKGIRKIKVSFIKQHMSFYDSIAKNHTHATLRTVCGIPFEANSIFGNGTLNITGKADADLVIVNHGVHYRYHNFLSSVSPMFNVVMECKRRGVQVIFRDSYAQHFKTSFGGEYFGPLYPPAILARPGAPQIPSWRHCSPLIFKSATDVNWRFQVLQKALPYQFSIMDRNTNIICRNSTNIEEIDLLPAYASTAPFWSCHIDRDCTHYFNNPGFFLPFFDELYRILYRNTLKDGECHDITSDAAMFVQGPEGMVRGTRENHDKEFLPTVHIQGTVFNLKTNETAIAILLN